MKHSSLVFYQISYPKRVKNTGPKKIRCSEYFITLIDISFCLFRLIFHEFFLPHVNLLHSKPYRINYFSFKGDSSIHHGVPIKRILTY